MLGNTYINDKNKFIEGPKMIDKNLIIMNYFATSIAMMLIEITNVKNILNIDEFFALFARMHFLHSITTLARSAFDTRALCAFN
jgi:hypothetical protein